jgi:hypothetical protein
MSLISKETLLTHLQRAEMASDVRLPIEFFRDLVYQAMPRTWVGLTKEERHKISMDNRPYCADIMVAHEEELKRRNT